MTVSLIAAVAANGVIGRGGRIPWRIPADLRYFKRVTMGHPVIMGRKTLDSLPAPLSGRTNIVLTRNPSFARPGVLAAGAPDPALGLARGAEGGDEVFIMGGAEVYALFLPLADRLYITEIGMDIPGDAFFPPLAESEWRRERSQPGPVSGADCPPYAFTLYTRKRAY